MSVGHRKKRFTLTPFAWLLLGLLLGCDIFSCAQPPTDAGTGLAANAYNRGLAALERSDLPTARSAFDQAVMLSPDNPEFQNALAQVMLKQGAVEDAIAHLRILVKLAPDSATPHLSMGQALEAKGSLEDAVAELREAVKLAPQESEVHRQLARALSLQGKTDDALAEMKSGVDLAPDRAELHDELGVLLAQKSQFAEAQKEFRSALALNATTSRPCFITGLGFCRPVIRMTRCKC